MFSKLLDTSKFIACVRILHLSSRTGVRGDAGEKEEIGEG
jgi:hypothetical protein